MSTDWHDDPRNKMRFYFKATFLRRLITLVLRAAFAPLMRLDVQGLEYLPRDGAVIVAANHVTNYDVFPLQFALPRPLFFMAKAELFKNPILGWLIRHLGAFPVARGARDRWALAHAARVLAKGQLLGMFPEGRRSKGRGLRVGKTGAARLSLESGAPILPVAITGTDTFFQHFPRRAQVRITILPLIYPRADESPLMLTERLMFTLADALPPEMRGVYAERPSTLKRRVFARRPE